MTPKEIDRVVYRQRMLPQQLRHARAKVRRLEQEAVLIGMRELLENPAHLDAAWERMIAKANLGNDE